jgi:hypothetical protein
MLNQGTSDTNHLSDPDSLDTAGFFDEPGFHHWAYALAQARMCSNKETVVAFPKTMGLGKLWRREDYGIEKSANELPDRNHR